MYNSCQRSVFLRHKNKKISCLRNSSMVGVAAERLLLIDPHCCLLSVFREGVDLDCILKS